MFSNAPEPVKTDTTTQILTTVETTRTTGFDSTTTEMVATTTTEGAVRVPGKFLIDL